MRFCFGSTRSLDNECGRDTSKDKLLTHQKEKAILPVSMETVSMVAFHCHNRHTESKAAPGEQSSATTPTKAALGAKNLRAERPHVRALFWYPKHLKGRMQPPLYRPGRELTIG